MPTDDARNSDDPRPGRAHRVPFGDVARAIRSLRLSDRARSAKQSMHPSDRSLYVLSQDNALIAGLLQAYIALYIKLYRSDVRMTDVNVTDLRQICLPTSIARAGESASA